MATAWDACNVTAEGADDVDAVDAAAEHKVLGHVEAPGCEVVDGAHVVEVEAFDGDEGAELAGVEAVFGVEELAVEAHGLADEELEAGVADELDQGFGVFELGDHGFGADDVFTVAQRVDAGLGVEGVGRVDADDVDVVAAS